MGNMLLSLDIIACHLLKENAKWVVAKDEQRDGNMHFSYISTIGLKLTRRLKDDLNVQIQVGERWYLKQSEVCEWIS